MSFRHLFSQLKDWHNSIKAVGFTDENGVCHKPKPTREQRRQRDILRRAMSCVKELSGGGHPEDMVEDHIPMWPKRCAHPAKKKVE
jgi:hypothetical protein